MSRQEIDPQAVTALIQRTWLDRHAEGFDCRPEAVATFFGVPADGLRNLDVPLDDVVGTCRARRLDVVLHGRPDDTMTTKPPEQVRRAFHLLRRMSLDEAAAALNFSSRHFRRLVVEHSGVGPKTYPPTVPG